MDLILKNAFLVGILTASITLVLVRVFLARRYAKRRQNMNAILEKRQDEFLEKAFEKSDPNEAARWVP